MSVPGKKRGRKRNSGLVVKLAAVTASLLADPTRSNISLAREHHLRAETVSTYRKELSARGAIAPNCHPAPSDRRGL